MAGQVYKLADRLGVGSPLIVSRPTKDRVHSLTVTVAAFVKLRDRLFLLTINTGYPEVRVAVQDHHFKLKSLEPPLGKACYVDEKCKICLVEVLKEIAVRLTEEQKCISGLYGEMCHVDVFDGECQSLVGREVQTIQKTGFRYGHIIGFDPGNRVLLVRNVYPGIGFSDEGDEGALVTSLPMKEAVIAYGVITGCDAAGVSRVHPFGGDLDYISRSYLNGESIRLYQPAKRPSSSTRVGCKKFPEEKEQASFNGVETC